MQNQPGIQQFLSHAGVMIFSCFTYLHPKLGELLRVEASPVPQPQTGRMRQVIALATNGVDLETVARAAKREIDRFAPEPQPPDPYADLF